MKVIHVATIAGLLLLSPSIQAPVAAQAVNPCAPINPCAPANPCAGVNPCASKNPCAATNPCAGANPCAGQAQGESADVEAAEVANAEFNLAVIEDNGTNVIELTQAPCQFLESEGIDLDFESERASDCQEINQTTQGSRVAQPLSIPAGEYTFRVTNDGIPYEVGFFLRGAGLGGVTLPRVSGGGLFDGDTQEYTIALTPGEYVYSCPLNPTLNYPLTVTAN